MTNKKFYSYLFFAAALYDGILGLAFLIAPGALFKALKVTPPNHFGYVQFPALLLMIFAWVFLKISKAPSEHRDLIPLGIMLKLSYCGVVFAYWLTSSIPYIWKPFAIFDLIFLALFVMAERNLKRI